MMDLKRLLVLYGSQTFTGQEIAERIWRMTKALGFRGPVLAMDDYPISELIHEHYVIFVCSTTGRGVEPDNMSHFWRFLLRANLPSNSLEKLRYGVLGLGDSSYAQFNFAGKKLHRRLKQLGATPLVDIGLCDYQHDLGHDGVMSPWIKQFFKILKQYFPDLELDVNTDFIPRWKVSLVKPGEPVDVPGFTPDIYFRNGTKSTVKGLPMSVTSNVRTTDESHFQDVRLIKLRSDSSDLNYKPGDVMIIRPRNSKEDIDDLFGIFETHNLDILPHHKVLIEECHEGPQRAAVIGGLSGGTNTLNSQDDEYRYAGVEDPKIMITTSREPSARLKMFVKELRLIFPNSQRMNRGGYEMSQLIHACRANEVTDFIVVHEHRGVPDSLVICHLPYGPTASFTLSGVVMRHDIPDIGPMSEQYPHLIFHNFKTDLDMPVPDYLQAQLTVYEIAEQYWDLRCYASQYVFSLLALVSEDKLEKEKCIELSSPEGQEEWLNYCRRPKRTVLEVLHDFHKSASKLTIEILFELFSTIKPRSFSIASSALPSNGHEIELLVAVVQYQTKLKKPRLGLASNWLKNIEIGSLVYGWIKNGTFQFPSNVETPYIMVGPGTGLAPFRSNLQERSHLRTASSDTMHLFFGCRYRNKDFHCKEELEGMVEKKELSLYTAFSRDQDSKVYVQHKIAENGELLWRLLDSKKACIFISGSSKSMPDNVRDAFMEDVLCKYGGYTIDEAKKCMADFENKRRFQTETW